MADGSGHPCIGFYVGGGGGITITSARIASKEVNDYYYFQITDKDGNNYQLLDGTGDPWYSDDPDFFALSTPSACDGIILGKTSEITDPAETKTLQSKVTFLSCGESGDDGLFDSTTKVGVFVGNTMIAKSVSTIEKDKEETYVQFQIVI